MKLNEDHLKPGTRILTTDKNRSKMVPGEIIGSYSKNGRPTQDYYNVKLDSGEEVILKYGQKASPGNFEVVVHEGRKTMKKETKPLLESYNRLFGKMDSFDRSGVKKVLSEGRLYDEFARFSYELQTKYRNLYQKYARLLDDIETEIISK